MRSSRVLLVALAGFVVIPTTAIAETSLQRDLKVDQSLGTLERTSAQARWQADPRTLDAAAERIRRILAGQPFNQQPRAAQTPAPGPAR